MSELTPDPKGARLVAIIMGGGLLAWIVIGGILYWIFG